MRILFDQGTPVPLRRHLAGHAVSTAFELGWSALSNGDLLAAAEGKFDLLIATDQNLRYQQNLTGRTLAILVLPTRWEWAPKAYQMDAPYELFAIANNNESTSPGLNPLFPRS